MVPAKCQVLGSSNCPLYKKGLTTPNENKVLNMIKQSTVIGVLWNAESKFGLHFRLTQLLIYVFLTFFLNSLFCQLSITQVRLGCQFFQNIHPDIRMITILGC